MRILVDGDSCPVLNLIEKIALKYELKLYVFFDLNHNISIDYGHKIRVDQEYQAVDMKLYNFSQEGDIVITGDYGLASLLLAKVSTIISPRGNLYTDNNINYLLMQRHQNAKIRRASGRHQSHKKRKEEDDFKFKRVLEKIIIRSNKKI